MKVYKVHQRDLNETTLACTLDQAKAKVNETEAIFRAQVTVAECELPTQKDALVAAINKIAKGDWDDCKELRKWHGTARGGLKLMEPS